MRGGKLKGNVTLFDWLGDKHGRLKVAHAHALFIVFAASELIGAGVGFFERCEAFAVSKERADARIGRSAKVSALDAKLETTVADESGVLRHNLTGFFEAIKGFGLRAKIGFFLLL